MSYGGGSGGSGRISTATDAALSNPVNNDVLSYNAVTQKWTNKAAAAASASGPEFPVNLVTRYGADPTGAADCGAAIRSALSDLAAAGGGTLYFKPGTYRVVTASSTVFFSLPPNVRLLGDGPDAAIIKVYADGGTTSYGEFARNNGNNVTIEGLTIQRATDIGMVLLNTYAYAGFTLRNVVIDGQSGSFATYCHAIQLGNTGASSNFRIERSVVKNVTFSILTTNSATGTMNGFVIRDSRFTGCGISFNAPVTTQTNILIEGNVLDGTGSDANAFGIDLAHVTNATIRDNTITNFAAEGIHIEDYSANVSVVNNRLVSCATGSSNSYGFMEIISGSTAIVIDGNTFDATGNGGPGPANAVLSLLQGGSGNTAGGRQTVSPNLVTITNNTILGGTVANGIYVDQCPSTVIAHNKIIGTGAVSGGAYSGPSKSALRLAGLTGGQINANIIRGWNAGVEDVAQTLPGTLFTQNLLRDCNMTLTARALTGAFTAGTVLYNCVSSTTLN